jgi:F-type H+-transporting ATPase subunit delta
MTKIRVARRYAEALVEMAEAGKNVDATIKDLEFIRESIKQSRELQLFLRNPIVNKVKKREILQSVFSDKIQVSTLGSLEIIVLKGREDLLPDIIEQFLSIWDERQGIVRVNVRTALEFSTDQTKVLTSKLEQYTRKKVLVSFGTDAKLIGGFVARVGDTVFDGSARRQLELLRLRFGQTEGMS